MKKGVFRVIAGHKSQYAGMFFMVLLSAWLFVLLALTAVNMNTNKNAYFSDYVQGDLEFYCRERIENIHEIEQTFSLTLDETLVRDYVFQDQTVRLFTPGDTVNIPAVLEGSLPSSGQIGLDPQYAKENGYAIGDSFFIDGSPYHVSGYICLPNYSYILQKEGDLINDPGTFGIGVISEEDAYTGSYLYSVKFRQAAENIYEQARPLKAYLNDQNAGLLTWTYADYDLKATLLEVETKAITAYALVLPPLLMLLSALLIAAVLRRMIKSQQSVIGTLYAMGYRPSEIIRYYLRYPLALGMSGGILGGLGGLISSRSLFDLILTVMPMPVKHISVDPAFILLSTVLVTAILCTVTWFSLKQMLGCSALSLMKNESDTPGPNALEKKFRLMCERLHLSFFTRFPLRELLRAPARLLFLFAGVLSATSLIILGFMFKSSLDYLVGQNTDDTLRFRYEYVLNHPQSDALPPHLEGIAGMKFVPRSDPGRRFEIIGASADSQMVFLQDQQGHPISIDDEKVIISNTMARKYNLDIGDALPFIDTLNDREHAVTITHIADTALGDVIFLSMHRFDTMMGWEKGSYNAILSMTPAQIEEERIYTIKTPEKLSAALEKYMFLITVLLYGISTVAAVLGLIIIYILASVSIEENQHTISLMKVFGYRKKELNTLMINGARFLVILGFLTGVPIAHKAIGGFLVFVFDLLDLTLVPRLEWYYVCFAFLLIFSAFELSKALCVRRIMSVSMSEALKAQQE